MVKEQCLGCDRMPDCPVVGACGGARQELAARALAYIEQHCTEKFSLDALAGALYVNKCYLVRAFHDTYGITPLACHNRFRCRRAGKLLEDSTLSVTEVGYTAGFASSSHFSRIFRQVTGVTPTEYRRGLSA